jgi:hypothetical protein
MHTCLVTGIYFLHIRFAFITIYCTNRYILHVQIYKYKTTSRKQEGDRFVVVYAVHLVWFGLANVVVCASAA